MFASQRGRCSLRVAQLTAAAWVIVALLISAPAAGAVSDPDPPYQVPPWQSRAHRVAISSPAAFTDPFCVFEGIPGAFICYTPKDFKTAYNVPSSLNGAGQTILIVVAYGSPTVQQDLDIFDAAMGLPATSVKVECPTQGCPPFDPTSDVQISWALETSLDVQLAHAIAPAANIVLVVAATPKNSDFNSELPAGHQELATSDEPLRGCEVSRNTRPMKCPVNVPWVLAVIATPADWPSLVAIRLAT